MSAKKAPPAVLQDVWTFERKVKDVDYHIEAEFLPSGAALLTFDNPLPGRTPSIVVDEDTVADLISSIGLDVEWDPASKTLSMTLRLAQQVHQNEDDPDYHTATETVGPDVILECVLEQVVLHCPHCGNFEFGNDVDPEEAQRLRSSRSPTYLN